MLTKLTLDEKLKLLSGESVWGLPGIDRVGLKPIRVMDGPVGVRSTPSAQGGTEGPSTNFPAVVCMSASMRPDLVEEIGRALGRETRAKGFHILLAPCINLHRVPIGGRNFESFSEDPHWVATMAVPYINGVQSEGIGTSLKHYAVNNQEHERMTISAEMDERTLHELYLNIFEQVIVAANPWTVMASYNKINGTHACENKKLLTDILRDTWGYNGVVISDWGAVHSGVPTVKAGCNIEMPGPGKFLNQDLKDAIEADDLTEAEIDALVQPILELYDKCHAATGGDQDNTPGHQALSREVAEAGMVLLKNEQNLLPLDAEAIKSGRTKLAVLGPLANLEVMGGGGSALVAPPYHITALQGIQEFLGDDVEVLYEPGCTIFSSDHPVDSTAFHCVVDGETKPGFAVDYFNNPDSQGTPDVSDYEAKLSEHYYFGAAAPCDGIQDDGYSIRWRATYRPTASGEHFFAVTSDEKARLSIDGQVVVENWDHPEINIPIRGHIALEAGRDYDFELCYAKTKGYGGIKIVSSLPQEESSPQQALEFAQQADAVLLFAGLNDNYETEGTDRESFSLPEGQDDLIAAVAEANPNTVVALYNGSPVDMTRWIDKVAGVLECWYPGQENGRAVANVVFGDVNPSGKLPTTFPRRLADASCADDYPGENGKVQFSEGVFIGYRHYDQEDITPLFPFGHGLSYTSFDYSNLQLEKTGDAEVAATCTITNTGEVAGAEGVQLYVRDLEAGVERPVKELHGLQKVFLQPGESWQVRFELDVRAFSFYDPATGGWCWEPGEFEILVGASSADLRLSRAVTL